jgi:hypothetical protein
MNQRDSICMRSLFWLWCGKAPALIGANFERIPSAGLWSHLWRP